MFWFFKKEKEAPVIKEKEVDESFFDSAVAYRDSAETLEDYFTRNKNVKEEASKISYWVEIWENLFDMLLDKFPKWTKVNLHEASKKDQWLNKWSEEYEILDIRCVYEHRGYASFLKDVAFDLKAWEESISVSYYKIKQVVDIMESCS